MRAGSVTPGFLSIPALAGIALTTSLCHAQVTLISNPPELFQYDLEEFSAVAARPGTAFAAIEDATLGIGFGEKLVGQINTPVGSFDVVNGTPAVPLTMDASVGTNFGVHLVRVFASTTIGGAGVLGFPNRDAIGEGSLTVLFGRNQRFVAFDLVGSSFGNLEILFFGRDGTLLDTQVLPETPDQSLAFKSEGQAIAAMTINNDDYGGVVYDNFRFNPGVSGQNDEACIVLGPDFIPFQADGAVTPLDAQVSAGFREASLSYRWATDCAEGAFDDATAAAPSLLVNVAAGCQLRC
ncbi:MAG: hypothetical protein ACE5EX_12090, partial [Phycisphaerae bacterium]